MTLNAFQWTDIALARGLRLLSIMLIAFILNRLLKTVTRRLIPVAGSEGLGRIAKMREQHAKTLAGLLYSAGTAIIIVGAILTALPEFGFLYYADCRRCGACQPCVRFRRAASGSRPD